MQFMLLGTYLLLVCQYCPISGTLIKTLFMVHDREQHQSPESVANKVLVPYRNLLNHQPAQRDTQSPETITFFLQFPLVRIHNGYGFCMFHT